MFYLLNQSFEICLKHLHRGQTLPIFSILEMRILSFKIFMSNSIYSCITSLFENLINKILSIMKMLLIQSILLMVPIQIIDIFYWRKFADVQEHHCYTFLSINMYLKIPVQVITLNMGSIKRNYSFFSLPKPVINRRIESQVKSLDLTVCHTRIQFIISFNVRIEANEIIKISKVVAQHSSRSWFVRYCFLLFMMISLRHCFYSSVS